MTGTAERRPSGTAPFWQRGDVICWRYGQHIVHPMTVVADGPDQLICWMAVGTPIKRKVRADGREQRADQSTMFTAQFVKVDAVWQDNNVLWIHRPGERWSTGVFFDGDSGAFRGWYCNIEEPHSRDATAIYTEDRILDVLIGPDRTVHRKDADELGLSVDQGRHSAAEAEAITSVADEIDDVIRAWDSPFCDGWEAFRPDPTWPLPPLPR